MRRFTFRLERVARIRQIEQDAAQADWVRATAAQTAVEQRIEQLREAARAEAAGIAVGQVRWADEVRATAWRADLRAQAIQVAVGDLARAQAQTRQAAEALLQASRKVDALERLRDRQREDWTVEATRDVAKALDDVTGTRAAAAAMQRQQVRA
jgi:flagellar export protein FliJ